MAITIQTLKTNALALAIALGAIMGCTAAQSAELEKLTVAGGCFWCVESDFESVPGVLEAVSGFAGGHVENPTYRQVTRGGTGHYEAVEIVFDPARVSRETLLDLFFRSIDPTDDGGQFCDRGDSYRTAVFVSDAAEEALAEAARDAAEKALGQPVVTPVLAIDAFYPADAYHQNYYRQDKKILTRFGRISKADAYKRYRKGCGRDARVVQLWGAAAPFAAGH